MGGGRTCAGRRRSGRALLAGVDGLVAVAIEIEILGFGMATVSSAAGDMAAPSPQSIKGDLLKIEGDFYVVKDMSGKETRMHVDKTTKLDGGFKTGDKVELTLPKTLRKEPLADNPNRVALMRIDGARAFA